MAEQGTTSWVFRVGPRQALPPDVGPFSRGETVTAQPGVAATVFFTLDRPYQRFDLEVRSASGEQWLPGSVGAVTTMARQSFTDYEQAPQADPDKARKYLEQAQSNWLLARMEAAARPGASPDAAMLAAVRDWVMTVGQAPPRHLVVPLAQHAGRRGDSPLDLTRQLRDAQTSSAAQEAWQAVEATAEGVRAAMAARGKERVVTTDGRVEPVAAETHREHWLALAACEDHPQAAEAAQWHLDRHISRLQAESGMEGEKLRGLMADLGSVQTPREDQLALAATWVSLRASGQEREADDLLAEVSANPQAMARKAARDPAALRARQQKLASLTGASLAGQTTAPGDQPTPVNLRRAYRAQIAGAAAHLAQAVNASPWNEFLDGASRRISHALQKITARREVRTRQHRKTPPAHGAALSQAQQVSLQGQQTHAHAASPQAAR
ncbi:hypothetical protein [Streptomyces sp. NBC_00470]|uniref:hypothetical protein n=1 Tax=Streptomyces sp. NBC_00470 TaxID=2975753 RepID=UPI002F91842A